MSVLTPCAEALHSLLFPFWWQGVYIPVLPQQCWDVMEAPVPFFVGLHGDYLDVTPPERRPVDVVIVDLDMNRVLVPPCIFEDDETINAMSAMPLRASRVSTDGDGAVKGPRLPKREEEKLFKGLLNNIPKGLAKGYGGRPLVSLVRQRGRTVGSSGGVVGARLGGRVRASVGGADRADRDSLSLPDDFAFMGSGNPTEVTAFSTSAGIITAGGIGGIARSSRASGASVRFEGNRGNGKHSQHSRGLSGRGLAGGGGDDKETGAQVAHVRFEFLRALVSVFRNYRKCIGEPKAGASGGDDGNGGRWEGHPPSPEFDKDAFLHDCTKDRSNAVTLLLTRLLDSQMWERFLALRSADPNHPEVSLRVPYTCTIRVSYTCTIHVHAGVPWYKYYIYLNKRRERVLP